MSTEPRRRALIYIRKSVVRTGADTVSPERQRQACLDEARRHGWIVAEEDIYADAEGHQSGRTDNRPDWQRLRRRLRRDGAVAAVIVESLSRASRSVRDFFVFVEDLRERGVALVSVKERFDTSSAIGQALLGMIAIINQLESDLASERMQSQIQFKKSQGRHWGLTPFGCEREEVTGALKPSTETYTFDGTSERCYHEGLRRCYELYAQGELGYVRLARRLNTEGLLFRSRQGEPTRWTADSTRSVLMMHRVYAGWVPVAGHNKDRPEEWVKGNYDPILPEELCERVGALLGKRLKQYPRGGRRSEVPPAYGWPYLLSRIILCAECRQPLRGHTIDGVRHYAHTRRGSCGQSWSDAEAIEAQAIDLLGQLAIPHALLSELADELLAAFGPATDEETRVEWERLELDLRRLEAELVRLVDLAVQTDLHADTYRRLVAERNLEIEDLRRRCAELEQRANRERASLHELIDGLCNLTAAVRDAPPNEQRAILRAVYERLEVTKEQIVRWVPREWCRQFF